jgi:hypothetical protein
MTTPTIAFNPFTSNLDLIGQGGGGGSGIITINGDTGSVTGSTVTMTGGSSGAFYTGSGTTMTTTFNFLSMAATSNTGNGVITFAANPTFSSTIHTYTGAGVGGRPNFFAGDGTGNFTNTGTGNIGMGDLTLQLLTSGNSNVGIGHSVLSNLTSGGANTALGEDAGINYTGAESANIIIRNIGVTGDNNTTRIGTQGSGAGEQNVCFIAGIVGNTVSNPNFVTINTATGQLGVTAGGGGFSSVVIQEFTSSGTYTPTVGMAYCIIEIAGGGGAGGGAAATGSASTGAGGGSGEIARGVFSAASIGASQVVTIGAAGAANSGATGGNGGNSSVGALISANGGTGGIATGNTTYAIQPGSAGGTGGAGGTFRSSGVTGTAAFINPGASIGWSGAGGSSPYGSGGQNTIYNVVSGSNVPGNNAVGFASGGGGGMNTSSQSATLGGAGTAGIVIITEFI